MPISHFIACKNYDERITTIHMGKVYDTFSSERINSAAGSEK
jgi:hypothetical protein